MLNLRINAKDEDPHLLRNAQPFVRAPNEYLCVLPRQGSLFELPRNGFRPHQHPDAYMPKGISGRCRKSPHHPPPKSVGSLVPRNTRLRLFLRNSNAHVIYISIGTSHIGVPFVEHTRSVWPSKKPTKRVEPVGKSTDAAVPVGKSVAIRAADDA